MTDQRIKEILEKHKDTLYSINGDWVSALEYDDALKALQQVRDEMVNEIEGFVVWVDDKYFLDRDSGKWIEYSPTEENKRATATFEFLLNTYLQQVNKEPGTIKT